MKSRPFSKTESNRVARFHRSRLHHSWGIKSRHDEGPSRFRPVMSLREDPRRIAFPQARRAVKPPRNGTMQPYPPSLYRQ